MSLPQILRSDRDDAVNQRLEAIKTEMGRKDDAGKVWLQSPEFGAATQKAYEDYLKLLRETTAAGRRI